MKRIVLFILLLIPFLGMTQIYQPPLLFGKEESRLFIRRNLGVPNDTFAIPSSYQDKPHIAFKGGILYRWDTINLLWVAYSSGEGGGGTENTLIGTGYDLLRESDQKIKRIYEGLGLKIDSTIVANSLQFSTIDTINSVSIKSIADLKAGTYQHIYTNYKKKNANDRPYIFLGGYYNFYDGGQGAFVWDDTSTKVDNGGSIIEVTGIPVGRWLRVMPSNEVNILWFGAKPSNSVVDATTNKNAFNAAKRALGYKEFGLPIFRNGGIIKIPRGEYHFDTTLVLDGGYVLRGDEGLSTQLSTRLYFSGNNDGIAALASKASPEIFGGPSIIENIGVFSYYQNPNDTTLHGFKIRGNTILKYCLASGFPGNGFDMNTDLGLSDDNYGNAAFSHLDKCRAEFNGNGFYFHGGDANVIYVTNCDATANLGWGFWEDGFLGNLFMNEHAADNTYVAGTKSQVKIGSTYYLVRKANKGIQPGVTSGWEEYYYQLPSTPGFSTHFLEWSVDSIYRGGGAYNSLYAINGNNKFINCYGEGGQLAQFGPRTMVDGGNMAALFIPENTEMRWEARNGNFVTLTPFRYQHANKPTIIEMGAQGLTLSPNESYTSSLPSYRWKLDHDSTGKKFRAYYDNFGYNSFYISTLATNPSDYGISSILPGMIEFPRGFYLSRNGAGGFRRMMMGTEAPANTTDWGIGSIIWRSPTAAGQSLGWRSIGVDTWEEIAWPGTAIDEHFANANLSATGNRTHDFNDFALSINDLSEFEINSTLVGTRQTRIYDYKPFYEGVAIQSIFDANNQSSLSVYNGNNTSSVYMDASGTGGTYTSLVLLPDTLLLNQKAGNIRMRSLTQGQGNATLRYDKGTGQIYWADTSIGGAGGSVKLNSIIAADGNNTINNGSTFHNWQWNSLASNYGLNFSTTSASQNGSRMLDITMSGTSSGSSSGIWVRNQNSGTGHNIGLEIDNAGGDLNSGILVDVNGSGVTTATGLNVNVASATNNYAIIVPSGGGNTGLGTSTPSTTLHVNGVNSLRYVDGNQALNKVLTSDGNGVASWQTPTTGSGTINSGTQFQIPYYTGTGTTVGPIPGWLTDANSSLFITSANDAPFSINATGTGLAGQYFQVAKFFSPNMGNGDINQTFFGKAASTDNSIAMEYNHAGDGSTSNSLSFSSYGAATPLIKMEFTGNVGIGLSGAPTAKLHVSGTGRFTDNVGFEKTISVGQTGTTQGDIGIFGATSGIVHLKTKAIAGTTDFIFPDAQAAANGYVLKGNTDGTTYWEAGSGGVTDHGALTGLGDDDHTIYALLAGRSGGQVLIGGTATTDDLTFRTTSADGIAGSNMLFETEPGVEAMRIANGGNVGIGNTDPQTKLAIAGTLGAEGQTTLATQSGNVTIGLNGVNGGLVRIQGATDGYVGVKVPATISVDYDITLPDAAPVSNGLVLSGNTDGTTNWVSAGAGDVTSNTGTSVNDEIALFNGTTGKQIKRASGSGFIKAASGVVVYQSTIALNTDVSNTLSYSNGGTGKSTIGTAGQVMRVNGAATAYEDFNLIQVKSLPLTAPSSSENISFFYTTEAITITEVRGVMLGSTPSATFQINYGNTRDAADGQVVSSITFDSGETGYQTSGFAFTLATTSIPAGNYIWVTTSAVSNVNELHLNLSYKQ